MPQISLAVDCGFDYWNEPVPCGCLVDRFLLVEVYGDNLYRQRRARVGIVSDPKHRCIWRRCALNDVVGVRSPIQDSRDPNRPGWTAHLHLLGVPYVLLLHQACGKLKRLVLADAHMD